MAYSSIEIPAAERALFDADRPCIVASNWARDRYEDGTYTRRWNQTGSFADIPLDATDFEALFGGDNGSHKLTKPDTAQNTWYYLLGFDSPQSLDSFALLNHNLGTLGATVALQIADDNTFATNLITLATVTPSDDKRIVELDLRHTGSNERRYILVEFARLMITGTAIVPQFGEVILGLRRQLKHEPQATWDPKNLRSDVARSVSQSGVITTYAFKKGQRFIDAEIRPWETAYINDIEEAYEDDTDFGTEPMLWIDDPATSPQDAAWMLWQDAQLVGPIDGPLQRQFRLSLLEQGPHYQAQE